MDMELLLCIINYLMIPFVSVGIDLRRKKADVTRFCFGSFLLYVTYMTALICVTHIIGFILIRAGLITEINGNTTRYTLISGIIAWILPYVKEILFVCLKVRCEIRPKAEEEQDDK